MNFLSLISILVISTTVIPHVLMMRSKTSKKKNLSRSFQTSSKINFLISTRKSLSISGQKFDTIPAPKIFIKLNGAWFFRATDQLWMSSYAGSHRSARSRHSLASDSHPSPSSSRETNPSCCCRGRRRSPPPLRPRHSRTPRATPGDGADPRRLQSP